jgi:hypothetical protein
VAVFKIKEGDLLPSLEHQAKEPPATIRRRNAVVPPSGGILTAGADLRGATSASFVFRKRDALPGTALSGTATIVTAEVGELRYDWTGSDTSDPGLYFGEFVVTFPTGTRTFPVNKPIKFEIVKDLDT